jgi:hypothetical protein
MLVYRWPLEKCENLFSTAVPIAAQVKISIESNQAVYTHAGMGGLRTLGHHSQGLEPGVVVEAIPLLELLRAAEQSRVRNHPGRPMHVTITAVSRRKI